MTAPGMRGRGAAAVEYAGIVVVVAVVIAGLMALRPHRVGRVPVDPVRAVGTLVHPAPAPRIVRPRPPRVVRPAPRRRPARPRPRRPVAMVPTWMLGP